MTHSLDKGRRPDGESPFLFWLTLFFAGCGVLALVMVYLLPYELLFLMVIPWLVASVVGFVVHRRRKSRHPDSEAAKPPKSYYLVLLALLGRTVRYILAVWGALAILMITAMVVTEYDQARRSREFVAQLGLRNYATAQLTFSLGRQATVPGNTPPGLGENAYADRAIYLTPPDTTRSVWRHGRLSKDFDGLRASFL